MKSGSQSYGRQSYGRQSYGRIVWTLTIALALAGGMVLTGCAPPPADPVADPPAEPASDETTQPEEPAAEEATPEMPAVESEKPAAEKPAPEAEKPAPEAEKPTAEEATPEMPAVESEKPAAEKPTPEAEKPAAEKPAPEAEKPAPEAEKPAAEEATPEMPAVESEKPAAEKPAPEVEKPAAEAEKPAAAGSKEAKAVSSFAPAEDLTAQVAAYLEDLEKAVATEEEYNDSAEKVGKQANTLILVALALGLHDTDNPHKAAAPGMIKAAQQLAAAKDFASAKAAVEAVKAASSASDGDPSALKWEKLASLHELMEAVPLINSRIKRYARSESRMKGAIDTVTGGTAVLAVIARGSVANSDETDKPDESEKWEAFCTQMCQAAGATNAAVRKFGQEETPEAFAAIKAPMEALQKSCDDCHEVFHNE